MGLDIDVTENFTYLGITVDNMVDLTRKSLNGLAWSMVLWTNSTLVFGFADIYRDKQKFRSFNPLVLLVLLCCHETWTFNKGLERHFDAFGVKCLNRIMGNDCVSSH